MKSVEQLKVITTDTGNELMPYGGVFINGAKAASTNDTWNEMVYELCIYNKLLTDAEVKRLFEE